MFRNLLLLILMGIVLTSVGCKNGCNKMFGNCSTDNATISPAATYSLNIPKVGSNQPYYTPGNPNRPPVDTTARAPVPGVAPNAQPGWGPTGAPGGGGVAPTSFVEIRPAPVGPGGYGGQLGTRSASLPGSGTPYTQSTNYLSTQIDERADSTRLPLSDASAVRAPSQFYTAGVPQNQGYGNYPGQQTYVAQNGTYPNGSAPQLARGVLVSQPKAPSPYAYGGNPAGVAQPTYANPQPAVLSQSTAVAAPIPPQNQWQANQPAPGGFQ